MDADSYGEKFDGTVLWVMIVLNILAVFGVVKLNMAFHESCTHSDYTYCEPAPASAEHH